MFLFSRDYFLHYLSFPGGITAYTASFFIQFFYYRRLGVIIYLGIFFIFYAVLKQVFKKLSLFENSFFIAFIPGLLFLPASACMLFDIADELSVIIALSGFIILTKLPQNRFYHLLIPLTVTALFVVTGGNILLSLTLFILYFLHRKFVVVISLLIPVILWYFFYMVSFKDACLSLTPFRYPDVRLFDFRILAWLSVGVIPAFGILLKHIRIRENWVFPCNIGLAAVILWIIIKQYHPDTENIVKMGFYAENHQWEDIIDTHKKTSVSPLNCFYTNFALQKTGQLAEKMFHYDQIGLPGLFIDSEDHFSCYAKSEWFYQMGLLNAARHFAFESMMGYSNIKEPNIRNMKRLLDCAVIRQDSALAEKYEKILNKTLFYRNDTKRQNATSYYPPEIIMKNVFIRDMPVVLEAILEDNGKNQAVFEYLMAYYLLERDYEQAKNCYDRYFSNFSYPHIPAHYAEFLALYKRLNHLDDSFYKQYPVTVDIRERFEMMDILVSAQMSKQIKKALEDGFKDTYWFYVRFPLVNAQTVKNEKKIY